MKKIKKLLMITFFIITFLISTPVYAEKNLSNNINLTISFKNSQIDYNIIKLIKESSGKVVCESKELGTIQISCSPKLIPKLKKNYNIDSISPTTKIKLNEDKISEFDELNTVVGKYDLYNKYQWDIKKITNNGKSFDLESGTHNVVVGIIDTGVNKNHPDLKSNFLGGENFVPKNFEGDETENGNKEDIEDRVGHGTHTAGIIAGNGRIRGVAPNIGFKSYRVFNSNNETNASIVASSIIKATNDGVKVINLSIGGYDFKGKCLWTDSSTGEVYELGSGMTEYDIYKRAISYATSRGVIVVASAGNESLDCSDSSEIIDYLNSQYESNGFKYIGSGFEIPGSIEGVIAVSSIGPDDKLDPSSNYGLNFIDMCAPGGNIINFEGDNYKYGMCLSSYKDSYSFKMGTSCAAPKVSAVAALIMCKYKDMNSTQVIKRIYNSTSDLKSDESKKYFGNGLINAYNALIK
ncbi:S8 family peptidase [Clostridium sporogenes]|uniref:S8 family peptidase n=1 Tax=Clostridium sporogenes TaxID=1509 RepID=UPI00197F7161|nr:S8 family serine peptidase [Clostridium sporogenes]